MAAAEAKAARRHTANHSFVQDVRKAPHHLLPQNQSLTVHLIMLQVDLIVPPQLAFPINHRTLNGG
jgi:hypothetical protein